MITKRYKLYKNFGKCMEISNGTVKALVTVDIGPRVIYYGVKGMNIMHEDIDRLTNKGGDFFFLVQLLLQFHLASTDGKQRVVMLVWSIFCHHFSNKILARKCTSGRSIHAFLLL